MEVMAECVYGENVQKSGCPYAQSELSNKRHYG